MDFRWFRKGLQYGFEKIALRLVSCIFSISLSKYFNTKHDLIVSNPPYISTREFKYLSEDIKKFEPRIALDGGNDGLDLIKKVIYKTKNILKTNGTLALEIGNKQFKKVSKILTNNNFNC